LLRGRATNSVYHVVEAAGGSDVQARAIGTAVALLAIGSAMCADAAQATFPGAPGRIVSGSFSGAATTRNPDGTDVREVVVGALVPQWSPDGSKLLYQAAAPNVQFGSWHAWTVNADGSQPTSLFDPREVLRTPPEGDRYWEDHVVDPSWAPDGRHLVFTGYREWEDVYDEGGSGVSQRIFTISTRGRDLRRLHAGWSPVWSPRGGTIAYVRGSRNGTEIASMRPNGRKVRVLRRFFTRGRVETYPKSLSFSPDGQRLAYIEHRDTWSPSFSTIRDSRSYLRILKIRTGWVREVPSSVTDTAVDVMWRPDGKRIAFLSAERVSRQWYGERSLYSLRVNGTDRRLMFPLPRADDVDWQPLPTAGLG
jgi:Tol biopolymer transport system component